ncbi:hypothetical protein [Nitrosospira multiformis]|uniref:Uncharacterized protein n=1 Tax=Nitrosospira multiformis TaxID=1231 RepID=A0A1I7HQL6_9PROT|nr:hypothetical protein [Nitrosospira multiformis]SFU62923.1 hypothetical protein SAMN05216417_1118 [Nitrosospira multiformis]
METLYKQLNKVQIPDTVSTLEKCEYFLNLASSEVDVLKFSWLISAFLEAAYSYFNIVAICATHSYSSTYTSGTWEQDEIFDKLNTLVHSEPKGPFGVTTALAPFSPFLVKQLFKFHERYIHHFPLAILTAGRNLPEDFCFGDSIRNGAPVLEFCRKLLVFLKEGWLRGAKEFDHQIEATEEIEEKKFRMNRDDPFFRSSDLKVPFPISEMETLCNELDIVGIPSAWDTFQKCEYFLNLASSEVNTPQFSWLISAFLEAAYSYFDVLAIGAMNSFTDGYTGGTWQDEELYFKILGSVVYIGSEGPFRVKTSIAPYSPLIVRHLFKFHEDYTYHYPLAILKAGPNLPEEFRFGGSIRNGVPALEFCRKVLVFFKEDWQEKYGWKFLVAASKPKIEITNSHIAFPQEGQTDIFARVKKWAGLM